MQPPIICLDIDGGLVSYDAIVKAKINGTLDAYNVVNEEDLKTKSWKRRLAQFDSSCVEQLNRITLETSAKIVVSSTWRLSNDYKEIIMAAGVIGPIIGRTRMLLNEHKELPRGIKIEEWLRRMEHLGPYVILDDD